ncbi:MAG: acyltransferase [Sphingobacteriales bacterium]|nr:MAG: acyltransferase [Sphingobacteriales bacterium]
MTDAQQIEKTHSIGYIESIDGIRGLFMLSVLLVHLHLANFKIPAFLAQFSLHLFFVLSAFLISSILYKQKERATSFKAFAKDFYIKRALRILPLYWAYILFFIGFAIILRLVAPTIENTFLGVVYDIKHFGWMLLTFTFNYREVYAWSQDLSHLRCHVFPHLWSISIEEQFYLIIPTVIYFLSKKSIRNISIIVILIYPFIRIFGFQYLRDVVQMKATFGEESNVLFNFFYRSSLFQFDAFFYGLLIPLVNINNKKILYALYVFFIALLLGNQIYSSYIFSIQNKLSFLDSIANTMVLYKNGQYTVVNTLYNLVSFCLVYIAVYFPNSFFNKLYGVDFLKKIGKIVYGFYVYHAVFALLTLALYYGFLIKWIPNILADFIAIIFCITTTYYFAKFSYYKFEMRFLKLKPKI